MKLSRALGWSAANVGTSLVVKLGSLVVLSRLLTPADFGVYNIGMAAVLLGALIAQLGVPTNLVALKAFSPALASTGLYLALASALLLALSGSGVLLGIVHHPAIHPETVALFAAILVCQVAINILEAVARRDLRLNILTVSELAAGLFGNLLVSVALALSGFEASALIIGQLVYSAVKISALAFAVWPKIYAWPSRAALKMVSAGSASILVAEVANMAAVQIQRPIIGQALGMGAAGIWSRVYQIVVLQLSIIVQPLDNLILPVLSRRRNEGKELTAMLASGIWAVSLITLPLSALTALWAPLMVPILFGPQWTALIAPLQILAPLLFFRGLERIMLSTSRATGTMGQRAVIQVVQLALVLIALALTLNHGLVAASWGYLTATAIGFGITVWRSYGTTGLSASRLFAAIAPGAATGGVSASIAGGLGLIGLSPYGALGLTISSAAAAVMAACAFRAGFQKLRRTAIAAPF